MDTEQVKQKLQAEQKLLHKELTELGIQNLAVPEDWIATPEDPAETEADENVVADRAEEWIERRGEVSELETRYNNVVRALRALEDSTYGTCTVCGNLIEEARLAANPAAQTCMTHLDSESQPNQ